MCCVSLTGQKKKLLVIGKSHKPRCFKSISYDHDRLPVDYEANDSAWMTSKIFDRWIEKWNTDVAQKNQRILLIADNFSGHSSYTARASNIEILFLPPNTTSLSQTLDAGIIKAFKDGYFGSFHSNLVRNLDALNDEEFSLKVALKQYSLLDAINDAHKSWENLQESTIVNCWKRTRITEVFDIVQEEVDIDHSYSNKNVLQ